MGKGSQSREVVRFGVFELDVRAGELRKQGLRLSIQGRPLQALAALLEKPGDVVTREELRNRIWPADTFVDFDHNLHNAIARLREALGDSSETPRFIETLPRRGYRFIGHVENSFAAADTRRVAGGELSNEAIHPGPSRGRVIVAAAALFLVVLVTTAVWVFYRYYVLPPQNPQIHSLAVLPLENLSRDPNQDFFAEGMTDALINDLAQIGNLRVISRTSIMQFRNTRRPLPEIARVLNVDAVVEGSVVWSNDRVRITVELIQATSDKHLWAQSYERNLTDILKLQDEVSRAIAGEIQVSLTPDVSQRLSSSKQVDAEAYQLYMKGRYFWVRRTEESVNRAISYFQQTIEKDQNYAAAYSGLADCYSSLGFSFDIGSLPPQEAQPKAIAEANKALQLDDSLAEAHNSLAYTKLNYDWDWTGSEEQFRRSLKLNPNYANAHHWYAHLLLSAGRFDEALAESNRALELDQLSPIMNVHLGWHYYFTRQYDRALEQLNKTLELDPNYGLAYWYRGLAYEQKHMYPEALREMTHGKELLKGNIVIESDIARLYAVSGNRAQAETVIADLKRLSRRKYVNSFEIAIIYVGLGQKDEAFGWLEKAYRERSDLLVYLKVDPRLDSIRADTRFVDLVRRVGIP
jgi:TolB-like protein/DNA-binding winged helix-turn-helix (wHTH) protein/tetratricopeptide (TPR) repeat protein